MPIPEKNHAFSDLNKEDSQHPLDNLFDFPEDLSDTFFFEETPPAFIINAAPSIMPSLSLTDILNIFLLLPQKEWLEQLNAIDSTYFCTLFNTIKTLQLFLRLPPLERTFLYVKIEDHLPNIVHTIEDFYEALLFTPIEQRSHLCLILEDNFFSMFTCVDDFRKILPYLDEDGIGLVLITRLGEGRISPYLNSMEDIKKIQEDLEAKQHLLFQISIQQRLPQLTHTSEDLGLLSSLLLPSQYSLLLKKMTPRLTNLLSTFEHLKTFITYLDEKRCTLFCLSMPKILSLLLNDVNNTIAFIHFLDAATRIFFSKSLLECHHILSNKERILYCILTALSLKESKILASMTHFSNFFTFNEETLNDFLQQFPLEKRRTLFFLLKQTPLTQQRTLSFRQQKPRVQTPVLPTEPTEIDPEWHRHFLSNLSSNTTLQSLSP